ncbi:unnamed protein product [Heligmosomoides polygyrus]|uniref:G_PROTEIN_RECEP_F1_2 domain-containing protein n=1 Tax=Heligmosomoides polygyrus TaxID=6339 RepID=A0A3P7Z188_HELPZ|nr:unnamed protein product [Heligmosomoides polygyrus]
MLLCFLCVYETFGLAYESVSAVRMLTNSSKMRRSVCFVQLSPYILMLTMEAVMLVMLAVDILFSIVSPVTHRSMRYDVYAVVVHVPCVCVAVPFIISAISTMDDAGKSPIHISVIQFSK